MDKRILLAVPVVIALIIAGSALVFAPDGLGGDNIINVRDTDLEEKIFDTVVHDHSLDSRRAIAFSNIIESSRLDLEDKLILNSVKMHDLSPAKKLLFGQLLDDDETLLKKRLIFQAVHEFDHHNFHDFDHDLHLGSGLKFSDVLDNLDNIDDQTVQKDCLNVWITHNLIKKICD